MTGHVTCMTLSAPLGGSYLHDSFSLDVERGPFGSRPKSGGKRQLGGCLVVWVWTPIGPDKGIGSFGVDPGCFEKGLGLLGVSRTPHESHW